MKMRTRTLAASVAAIVITSGLTTAATAVPSTTPGTDTQDVLVGSSVTLSNKAALPGGKTCVVTDVTQTSATVVNALTFTVPSTNDSVTSNEVASNLGTDTFTLTCVDQSSGGKTYTTNATINVLDNSTTTISTPAAYYLLSAGSATLTATVGPAAAAANAVTWTVADTSSPAAGCLITDNTVGTVTFTGVGTCDVTATSAKANNYFSSSATQSITIKGETTADIMVSPTQTTYFVVGDSGSSATTLTSSVTPLASDATPTYSIDSGATNSANCSIGGVSSDRLVFTAAGVCTAKVTYGDSTNYYLGSTDTVVVNVYSVPAITLADYTFEDYRSGSATVMSSTTSTGTKGYTLVNAGTAGCSISSGGVVSWTSQGTCTVKATVGKSDSQKFHSAESTPATITIGANITSYTVTVTGYAPKGKKALSIRRANAVKAYLQSLGLNATTNVTVTYVVGGKTVRGTGSNTLRTIVGVEWTLAGNRSTIAPTTVLFGTNSSSLTGTARWAKNARRVLGGVYQGTDLI